MKILSSIRAEAQRARIIKRATLRAQWDAAGRLGSLDDFERRQRRAEVIERVLLVALIVATVGAWWPVVDMWWLSCC